MLPDRSWIYRRVDSRGYVTNEFKDGVTEFIDFVMSHPDCFNNGLIRCPCAKCRNNKWLSPFWVEKELWDNGFHHSYVNWIYHGETRWESSSSINFSDDVGGIGSNRYVDMVMDAAGENLNHRSEPMEEEPDAGTRKFYDMLRHADEPLWDGCTTYTVLSAVTKLLNLKSEYGLSEGCYDRMIDLIKGMLPESEKLPANFYQTKKMVSELGLGYEKIDVCRNFCVLYYKEYEAHTQCPICNEPRYKKINEMSRSHKKVSYKSVRYLPVAPRLKRLYLTPHTAEYMRWHANGIRQDQSYITHPSDALAWRHFDASHPSFASEVRNVRLGLCTDGFNPFTNSTYSCWPVFVTPYNFPPSMLMRSKYIYLTLLIPGPRSPGKNLDVCLRPLIDELQKLWFEGETVYDSLTKQTFVMRAALMWTISDFPAYGMLSGWSTHGKLACPYCGDKCGSIVLKHGRKCSWFDCHRQFLPPDHPFRRDRQHFTRGKVVNSNPPIRLSGESQLDQVRHLRDITFGFKSGKQKQPGFGIRHNWVKKSIFWELPYWSTNLIRHNVDVMHVEKNVFDNIFNTVMDFKGKTKDNANARADLKLICNRPELELVNRGDKLVKPKATYALDQGSRKFVCEWIKQLKFPDGYASNLGRCINVEDSKVYGMKSHDCHVFMQRLLPIAFRDLLPKPIWGPLVELGTFFKELCSTKIRVSTMEGLEASIIVTLCKLEKNFPPGFFDVMEHLIIHLPYEAKVGGTVHTRWMYPFERKMLGLKRKVHNRARVEGSICEAYIVEEISDFVSQYFEPDIQTKRTRLPRNDDGGEFLTTDNLSISKHPCRPLGGTRTKLLSEQDLHVIETYVMVNSPELEPYLKQFEDSVRALLPTDAEYLQYRDKEFRRWLKCQVEAGAITDNKVKTLNYGPFKRVRSYNGIIVNGYRFNTHDYQQFKSTSNSGVCCRGSLWGDDEADYYGVVEDILELDYVGDKNNVFLLRCHWFDPFSGVKTDSQYNLVEVNPRSRLNSYDPFILASQAEQVYYTNFPNKRGRRDRDWWAVCKVRPKLFEPEHLSLDTSEENVADDYYQEDEPSPEAPSVSANIVEEVRLHDTNAEMIEIPITELYIPLNIPSVEQQIVEGEFDGDDTENVETDSDDQSETATESD